MFTYRLNADSDIPVYRQLADQIHAEIRSGALKTGMQLPTVREMAERMHLSCGTVKRVYDRLRELGDIDMTRRRGSFVKYVREASDSRKLMAMNAIDDMLRRLSSLNFSPREIQIFLNLKLREWGVRQSGVRVGVVTPCAEIAGAFDRQLEGLGNVQVLCCDMARMREYPYTADEESDLLICAAEDAPALRRLIADEGKLVPVALSPRREALIAAATLPGKRVCVLSSQAPFAQSLKGLLPARFVFSSEIPDDADALVVSANMSIADAAAREKVERFRKAGRCVTMDFEIDAGSMLSLTEHIGRLREERQLRPAALDF